MFAHTESHIVSAPMAKFIVQNDGRFKKSHETVFTPFNAFINKTFQSARVAVHGNNTYLDKVANDYLHRPDELEDLNLFSFFSQYSSRSRTIADENLLDKKKW